MAVVPVRRYFAENPEAGVWVTESEGGEEPPWPLEHHVQHSPTGFAWGYGGSGPSELARCILWDHLGGAPSAEMYQDFKRECIAPVPQDAFFEINSEQIADWISGWRIRQEIEA